MRILVAVASKHGSTWEIARGIGDTLAVWGVRVDVAHVEDVDDLNKYDGFVIGSAVYAGRWLKPATAFIEKHAIELTSRPVWLFSSGPLGSPPKPHESKAADIRPITKLIRIREHRVFAGRLSRMDLAEKIITMALHVSQGDYRNWADIHAWAAGIAQALKCRPVRK
ncbi:MAG TPA: flavodoxin domain-containing protein [Candidatus Saccharimonadales bacterium]|nr:flavodoxin domain-containing protein [Candidatus Saccharimonadales bacterium]